MPLYQQHIVSEYIQNLQVYRIMKENGPAVPLAAKSRERKWIRYGRRHSNPMRHTDRHAMKDPP